jgi:uncharacterized protein (DUF1697 family)
MATHAAFLRGINISNRRTTNQGLEACFAKLDLDDVTTFRASGNVVFTAEGRRAAGKLQGEIEEQLERSLGYPVPTFLRTAAQMRAIAEHQPFPAKRVAASDGKLQTLLLAKPPTAAVRKEVLALALDEDPLTIEGSELYWLPSGNMRDSNLDLKAVADAVGLYTQRTKGTLDQIAAKFFAD